MPAISGLRYCQTISLFWNNYNRPVLYTQLGTFRHDLAYKTWFLYLSWVFSSYIWQGVYKTLFYLDVSAYESKCLLLSKELRPLKGRKNLTWPTSWPAYLYIMIFSLVARSRLTKKESTSVLHGHFKQLYWMNDKVLYGLIKSDNS